MKKEPKTSSGMKVAGVLVLLATLLLLAPAAATDESYAVQIRQYVDDSSVDEGQTVTFTFTVTSAGNGNFDDVTVSGITPFSTGYIGAGTTETFVKEYVVDFDDFTFQNGRYILPNLSTATAYRLGNVVSIANARTFLFSN